MIDIDKIFFINLDHRTDRWEKIEKEFIPLIPDQYQDKVERFSAIDHTEYDTVEKRAAGCAYSHLEVWKKCKEENLNTVLIFEDDIEWCVSQDTVRHYLSFLENIDFDMVNISYRIDSIRIPTKHDQLVQALEFVMGAGYIVKVDFLVTIYDHVKREADKMFYDNAAIQSCALDVSWLKYLFDKEKNKINNKWFLTREKLVRQYINYSSILNTIHDAELGLTHTKGNSNETI